MARQVEVCPMGLKFSLPKVCVWWVEAPEDADKFINRDVCSSRFSLCIRTFGASKFRSKPCVLWAMNTRTNHRFDIIFSSPSCASLDFCHDAQVGCE